MRKWILLLTFSMVTLTAFSKNVTLTIRCPDPIIVDHEGEEIDYKMMNIRVSWLLWAYDCSLSAIRDRGGGYCIILVPEGVNITIEVRGRLDSRKAVRLTHFEFMAKKDTTVQIIPYTDEKGQRKVKIKKLD